MPSADLASCSARGAVSSRVLDVVDPTGADVAADAAAELDVEALGA